MLPEWKAKKKAVIKPKKRWRVPCMGGYGSTASRRDEDGIRRWN